MVGLTFMFGLVNQLFLSQNPSPPPTVLNTLYSGWNTILNIYQMILTLWYQYW